jgi:alpha-tubulin suppressor-like RCC1 family protein
MIASIVMLIVLVAALSAVSATRTALTDQYYNQLAKEAAESGVQFLLSCLKSNETPTFGVDYRPNSASCTDSTQTSTTMKSVVASSRMESTFAVRITGVEGDYYLLTAKGTVDLLRQSNGMVWSSKEHSLKVNVHKAFLSITDFAVVTRGYNMFVVRPDGSLWAWGRNTYGAIGSGAATATVTTPTKIISSGVVKVATNSSSTYAVKSDGSLWAWGANGSGQLGDGSTTDRSEPVGVISSGVTDVYVRGDSAYAVKSDGSLWAWGANSSGLVGNNSTTDQTTPVRIVTSGVKELYGSPSAAVMYLIKTDGSLWAWGTASRKAIGNGSSSGLQLTPVRVIASGVRQVAVSYLFDDVSVLMSDGTVRRWGYYYGVTPSVVTGLSGVSRLIGTSQSTYAITAGGALYAWGQNSNGTIGNGVAGSRVDAPYRVFSSGVVDVNTSRSQPGTIALRSDGGLWGWGQNNYCQQADGTTVNRYSPVQVMTNIASMYTYSDGSYGAGAAAPRFAAVTRDGSLYAWGSNMLGAVGNGVNEGALSGGTSQCTPHKVMDSVLLVADSDYYTTYIVTADFNVWSFGANNYSQLGRTGANSLPGQVSLPTIPPLYY